MVIVWCLIETLNSVIIIVFDLFPNYICILPRYSCIFWFLVLPCILCICASAINKPHNDTSSWSPCTENYNAYNIRHWHAREKLSTLITDLPDIISDMANCSTRFVGLPILLVITVCVSKFSLLEGANWCKTILLKHIRKTWITLKISLNYNLHLKISFANKKIGYLHFMYTKPTNTSDLKAVTSLDICGIYIYICLKVYFISFHLAVYH